MPSKRVTLKWRKVRVGTKAGPFTTRRIPHETEIWGAWLRFGRLAGDYVIVYMGDSEAEAKRACETLAARILGAMKGSQ